MVSVRFVNEVFQRVKQLVRKFPCVRFTTQRSGRMIAGKLASDDLKSIGFKNGVGIQKQKQIAARFFRPEVASRAKAALAKFVELIAQTLHHFGGTIVAAIGHDNGLKIPVTLLLERR